MFKNSDHIIKLIHHYQQFGSIVLLESQKKDHPASFNSYLAAKPIAWIKSRGKEIITFQNGQETTDKNNPWIALSEFKVEKKDWLFGYLGYDLKNEIEDLHSKNPSFSNAPDMFFMVPEVLIQISSQGEMKYLRGNPEDIKEVGRKSFTISEKSKIEKEDYLKKVRKAKNHIEEGDYYEINISHPIEFTFEGEPLALYSAMGETGPVPFASYVFVDGISICCSSPERFLARQENKVWSQPIKGTISRTSGEDLERRNLLQQSEKDRAENLMIVDLVRNDLNRIAEKGSVKVKNLFEIQSFDTVHQMVSTVECEVSGSRDSIEIIQACFPMGSMTGAPKISAMQSIEELEDYKRGIYSGAIGYFTPGQDFDFNVIIRTAIIEGNKLVYPVGGAITSDSIPEEEWEETLIKSRALTNSLD